jgi:N-acetylmuramic acid 6-phosphate etherase
MAGKKSKPSFLGIECGATHSVALAVDAAGKKVRQREFGPANLRLLTDAQLLRHLRAVATAMPPALSLCIGMAGARSEADLKRIRRAAAKVWPGIPCHATNDLETALMAADSQSATAVLVLSGTGSCVFGRTTDGRTAKIGGWGHILGDKGSGFEIGLRALKAVVYYFDRDGEWPALGARLLRSLLLNAPDDLIAWVREAEKPEIATLATDVFAAAKEHDKIATDILLGAAHSLAADGAACAAKLTDPGANVEFLFSGSVLTKQPAFAGQVKMEIRRQWPGAVIRTLDRESVWGAVRLAQRLVGPLTSSPASEQEPKGDEPAVISIESLKRSPTEQRNPASMRLHQLSIAEAVKLMIDEEASVSSALIEEQPKIVKGVQLISRSLKGGGRLFYVGAGTSGRLGVLDASECPPTFQSDPDTVQGIIAGGQRALWSAVEGAEDDPQKGAEAVRSRGVKEHDVVVGIAASGRTPFVWGALDEARALGAKTILLTFNPFLEIPKKRRPDLVIAPNAGPELLTGSTRLKSGTATKLVLNMFTTLAMVQLGKVFENLMIDVKPSNIKLRDRAVRIVQELTSKDYDSSRAALEKSEWKIRLACARLGKA